MATITYKTKKITELESATALNGEEKLVVLQDGISKQTDVDNFLDFINSQNSIIWVVSNSARELNVWNFVNSTSSNDLNVSNWVNSNSSFNTRATNWVSSNSAFELQTTTWTNSNSSNLGNTVSWVLPNSARELNVWNLVNSISSNNLNISNWVNSNSAREAQVTSWINQTSSVLGLTQTSANESTSWVIQTSSKIIPTITWVNSNSARENNTTVWINSTSSQNIQVNSWVNKNSSIQDNFFTLNSLVSSKDLDVRNWVTTYSGIQNLAAGWVNVNGPLELRATSWVTQNSSLNLDASKIVSGVLNPNRLPLITPEKITGVLSESNIPTIPANKISGSLSVENIPIQIPATKIGSGIINNDEFNFLNNLTGNIQQQLNQKVNITPTLGYDLIDNYFPKGFPIRSETKILSLASQTASNQNSDSSHPIIYRPVQTSEGNLAASFALRNTNPIRIQAQVSCSTTLDNPIYFRIHKSLSSSVPTLNAKYRVLVGNFVVSTFYSQYETPNFNFSASADDTITVTSPNIEAPTGGYIKFNTITNNNAGVNTTSYYKVTTNPAPKKFKISPASGGANINITANFTGTAGKYVFVDQSADIYSALYDPLKTFVGYDFNNNFVIGNTSYSKKINPPIGGWTDSSLSNPNLIITINNTDISTVNGLASQTAYDISTISLSSQYGGDRNPVIASTVVSGLDKCPNNVYIDYLDEHTDLIKDYIQTSINNGVQPTIVYTIYFWTPKGDVFFLNRGKTDGPDDTLIAHSKSNITITEVKG
jgi:hypothetical protein